MRSRLSENSTPTHPNTINFKKFICAAWVKLTLAALVLGSFLFIAPHAFAAVKDLKLTGKTTGKNFVAGNFKYKGTNVTVVSYKPAGKTKPVTALIFDTFSLANYVTDPVEKALLADFRISRCRSHRRA